MKKIIVLAVLAALAAGGVFYVTQNVSEKSSDKTSDKADVATTTSTTPVAEITLDFVEDLSAKVEEAVDATIDATLGETGETPAPEQKEDKTENLIQHDDVVFGSENAPVTIIEYASLSCGHCAKFHKDVLPLVKERLVNSGKIRFVYRDFPLNAPALKGAQLVQCVVPERRESLLNALYSNQDQWTQAKDVEGTLEQYAALVGLQKPAFETCMKNEDLEKRILEKLQEGQTKYNVEATPSFIVIHGSNVKKFSGVHSLATFEKIIEDVQK